MVEVARSHSEVVVHPEARPAESWLQEAQQLRILIDEQQKLEQILIASGQLPEMRRTYNGNQVQEKPYESDQLYHWKRRLHYINYRLRQFSE